MKLFGVYGASGFGREVMPLVRKEAGHEHSTQFVFVDDAANQASVNGHVCMTFEAFCSFPAQERAMTIAIGNGFVRETLLRKCEAAGVSIMDVRADSSILMDDVKIGEGVVLCAFTMITSNVSIGRQFHANIYSYVAHDCAIGDFVTFAPGVMCNGNVHIEDHAYIGTGAILRQGKPNKPLLIGRGAIVGMGAVVTRDVPPGVTVVGNPARPLIKD